MGCDWAQNVWDISAGVEELEGAVGVIVLALLLLTACSEVSPYIRSDSIRLDRAERVEVGLKGKF